VLVYYKETLPKGIPPSYRGHAVRYWYKVAIGTQRVGSPIKIMQIPVKLLVIHGFSGIPPPSSSSGMLHSGPRVGGMRLGGLNTGEDNGHVVGNAGSDTVSPSNPFLESSAGDAGVDVAMEFLQVIVQPHRLTDMNLGQANYHTLRAPTIDCRYDDGKKKLLSWGDILVSLRS
jgi:hypothetical protein